MSGWSSNSGKENARGTAWMNKELMAKLKTQKGSIQRVEARTGNPGGKQRHCPSMQG